MKSLDLSSPVRRTFLSRRSGSIGLFDVAGVLMAFFMLFLAFRLHGLPAEKAVAATAERATAVIELAGEAAARPLQNVRNSLTLLARMPVLRQFKHRSPFVPFFKTSHNDLKLLIASYELPIAMLWESLLAWEQSFTRWSELPQAFMRRVTVVFSPLESEGDDSSDPVFMAPTVNDEARDRIFLRARLVPNTIELLTSPVDQVFFPLISLAAVVDSCLGAGKDIAADAMSAGNLLAAALNDDLFRTITLKSLQGSVLAVAGDADAAETGGDSRDCQAINKGVPFFSGPTGYDLKRGRALWWVAVPVRDENRRPVACLSALVDINYLSALAIKGSDASTQLFFVDRNGIAIGHAEQQMVSRQVNLSTSLLATADIGDKIANRFFRRDDRRVFQAAGALKNTGHRYLPDWYVFFEENLSADAGMDYYLLNACVILLAATGMYVLSCCVVRLFNSQNEEN